MYHPGSSACVPPRLGTPSPRVPLRTPCRSFTPDTNDYVKAMRLFVGVPVWTPHNRKDEGVEAMKERQEFVAEFVKA